MDSNLLFNKAPSFKLIRLHVEDLCSYIHSSMPISPFLIIRKIGFREATKAVQLQALLLLLFLQASAKMLSDFDTRQKHNYVNDSSVMMWPNSYLLSMWYTDTPSAFMVARGLILKTLFQTQNTFKKPPQWSKGVFLCFLQTKTDVLEFKVKFYSIVEAFPKPCFRNLKLFRIQITLAPFPLHVQNKHRNFHMYNTYIPQKFPAIDSCTLPHIRS